MKYLQGTIGLEWMLRSGLRRKSSGTPVKLTLEPSRKILKPSRTFLFFQALFLRFFLGPVGLIPFLDKEHVYNNLLTV